jgi:hypothetical protein
LGKKYENKLICALDKDIAFSAFCECVLSHTIETANKIQLYRGKLFPSRVMELFIAVNNSRLLNIWLTQNVENIVGCWSHLPGNTIGIYSSRPIVLLFMHFNSFLSLMPDYVVPHLVISWLFCKTINFYYGIGAANMYVSFCLLCLLI